MVLCQVLPPLSPFPVPRRAHLLRNLSLCRRSYRHHQVNFFLFHPDLINLDLLFGKFHL